MKRIIETIIAGIVLLIITNLTSRYEDFMIEEVGNFFKFVWIGMMGAIIYYVLLYIRDKSHSKTIRTLNDSYYNLWDYLTQLDIWQRSKEIGTEPKIFDINKNIVECLYKLTGRRDKEKK